MKFEQPEFLWLLWGIPALWVLFVYADYKRKQGLKKFLNFQAKYYIKDFYSLIRSQLKHLLLLFGFLGLIVALARPQYDQNLQLVQTKNLDIVFTIDVSSSMNAQDIKPSRLARTKHELAKLIDKFKGDRVGLVVFAGDAFLQCPLTNDYTTLKIFLDILSSDLIQNQGTDIGKAIETGLKVWKDSKQKNKVMLLISDGEEHTKSIAKAIKKAKKEQVTIYVIGVGSSQGIPIPDLTQSKTAYKKDAFGNIILTKLNQEVLKSIATQTNGKYFQVTPESFQLKQIFKQIESLERSQNKEEKTLIYQEYFQIPLGFALICFLLERFIVRLRKKSKKSHDSNL